MEGCFAMDELNHNISVEKIMDEIRDQIRREKVMADIPSFEDIPIRDNEHKEQETGSDCDWPLLMESLQYVNRNYDVPYYWSFGPNSLKTFAKRVVRKLLKCLVAPILAMQNNFNAHVVQCLNQLRYFYVRQENTVQHISQEQNDLRQKFAEQTEKSQGITEELNDLRRLTTEQAKKLDEQENLKERISQLEDVSKSLQQYIERIDRQTDAFSASVAKTILEYKTEGGALFEKPELKAGERHTSEVTGDSYTALDYFKFQNDFRGTRSLIADRQAMYLPYFKNSTKPVLDLGCGRGEFLRILKEQNIPSFGIDMYPEYVIEGQLNGLDVRQGDGIAFLKETDIRFGGIFAAQVIEHISFEDLQILCFTAYEKLESGGHIVLETPNPTCLAMFTSNFYLDPTHTKPIHPLLLAYVLREAGFSEVQTIYTDASRAGKPLPFIDGEGIRNLEEINRAIAQVSDLLYGSLDYAVVAKK